MIPAEEHKPIEARQKTPAVTRTIAENMRPIKGEAARTGGTANKTNAGVNSAAGKLSAIGKGSAVVSGAIATYNVATAENKGEAIVTEGGAMAGAIAGGEIGAEMGAVAGVPGAIVGGLIGSIVGSIIGDTVTEGSMNGSNGQSQNYDQNGQHMVSSDATRVETNKEIIR